MLSSLLGNPESPEVFLMVCILDLLTVIILCGYVCKTYFLEPLAQHIETLFSKKLFWLEQINFFKEIKLLTWCPTSHMILSSGVLNTWCRAPDNSTTPKLELRCPPIFDTVYTISALSSAASCSRSWEYILINDNQKQKVVERLKKTKNFGPAVNKETN